MGCLPYTSPYSSSVLNNHCWSPPISKQETTRAWINNDYKLKQRRVICHALNLNPITATATSSFFPLLIAPPATSGNYSTIIPIGMGLLFVYWIANFVVPDLISKEFEALDADGDRDGDGDGDGDLIGKENSSSNIDTPVTSNKSKGKKRSKT